MIGRKGIDVESEEKMKEDFLICLLVDVLEPLDQGFNIVKANVKWELKKKNNFFQSKEGANVRTESSGVVKVYRYDEKSNGEPRKKIHSFELDG